MLGAFVVATSSESEDDSASMEIEIDAWTGGIFLLVVALVVIWFLKPKPPETNNESALDAQRNRMSSTGSELDHDDGTERTPISIYYGSQTGTAEGFAKTLSKEAKRHGFKGQPVDLDEFDPEKLKQENAAIFLMATYGEGDPTDNAMTFHSWLIDKKGDLQGNELENFNFCVFGLGNRQYEHFNQMGKVVDRRLEELGGTRLYERGEGDDDGDIEEDFESWKAEMWNALVDKLRGGDEADKGEEEDNAGGLPPLPEQEWKVVRIPPPKPLPVGYPADPSEDTKSSNSSSLEVHKIDLSSRHYFTSYDAKVLSNKELRQQPTEESSTKHLEICIKNLPVEYDTADNLGVLPENSPEVVENLCQWIDLDPDQWIKLEPAGSGEEAEQRAKRPIFPTPCTVRTALLRYCDLHGPPRKNLLGKLAHFATKSSDKSALAELASSAGKHAFHDYVHGQQKSVWEVFQDFPSIRIPLNPLLEYLPRLQPRYYTIASSSKVHPERIHLAVSMIHSEKPGSDPSRVLKGVCSTYMANQQPPPTQNGKRLDAPVQNGKHKKSEGERKAWPTMKIFVRPSTFSLPDDPSRPVIMIGPGTGIAPMRAFLQERRYQRLQNGATVGPTVLFFGCRRRDEDFIYKDELEEFYGDGTLTHFYRAFSREGKEKVYVQHLLEQHGGAMWPLIHDQRGHVYVCGATSMGHDVHATLERIVEQHGNRSTEEAKQYVKELANNGRYIQELWS
eukprot:gb/GECG01008040.1/.p1 GENE.gb/GECG01008040.1/~~gb/GECG01008040.1/.p1  ORF type:complete len:732 (+),score=118.34 gb/GECG01008040.1/:1-2196(+)